jgi:hydrogenase maturation protease
VTTGPATPPRVLIVGVGNVLHGDDGFGVEVAHRLAARDLPPGVTVAETGIGGIHLVHELMAGFDALIVVDAVDHGRPPGTVLVIEPEVLDVKTLPVEQRHDLMADMHLATPELALMVARAVGVLPAQTLIVGCQPVEINTLGIGLTDLVNDSVDVAIREILRCVSEFVPS